MKFSIRDLLLVTVIVALGVGWWVQRRQSQADALRIEQLTKDAKRLKQRSAVADTLLRDLGQKLEIDEQGGVRVYVLPEAPSPPPNDPGFMVPANLAPAPNSPKK